MRKPMGSIDLIKTISKFLSAFLKRRDKSNKSLLTYKVRYVPATNESKISALLNG